MVHMLIVNIIPDLDKHGNFNVSGATSRIFRYHTTLAADFLAHKVSLIGKMFHCMTS